MLNSPGGFTQLGPPPGWVVYMHGFRSSSASVKAQKTIELFEQCGLGGQLWVPDLPASPAQAMALLRRGLEQRLAAQPGLSLAFVGSSLGGYYATALGQAYPQAKMVLLNPAVTPYIDLQNQIGRKQVYFSDEEIEFVPAYLDELKAMETVGLTRPERAFLVAATGDEVLSCDQMLGRYPGAHQLVLQGSDHALSEYDQILPMIALFLGVR